MSTSPTAGRNPGATSALPLLPRPRPRGLLCRGRACCGALGPYGLARGGRPVARAPPPGARAGLLRQRAMGDRTAALFLERLQRRPGSLGGHFRFGILAFRRIPFFLLDRGRRGP